MKRRRRNLPRTKKRNPRRAIAGALTGVLLISMLVVVGLGNATTGSSSASAAASQYTEGDWRAIPLDEEFAVAFDVNAAGVVAGYVGSPTPRAVLWGDSGLLELETPDGLGTVATAVNTAGAAAGALQGSSLPGNMEAAFWDGDGALHRLGYLPGGGFSNAHDLSDLGQVVGIAGAPCSAPCSPYNAFVWNATSGMEPLPRLDSGFTSAEAANSAKQVVGWSGSSAVLWEDGELVVLPTLEGGTQASAWDINDAGVAVGGSTDSSGIWHAVMWEWSEPDEGTSASASEYQYGGGWQIVDLGSLGSWTNALGINEAGQVVGAWRDNADLVHGFFWEDGTFNLLPSLPGDDSSFGSKINDAGLIAGASSATTPSISHAVVWTRASDPAGLLAELAEDVADLGPGTSLAAKIAQAQDALALGNTRATCGALQAFINEVEAQTGKSLTPEQANGLIAKAQEIESLIGC
jgi:probable HAF family extracellular repeat protein